MKRLLAKVALAIGLAASLSGAANAQGQGGFGFGVGIGLTFSGWKNCQPGFGGQPGYGGQSGCCGAGGCLPPPCWSPCYAPPMPYGGLMNYNPAIYYPNFAGYPGLGYGK
ncbi:MAG: hypothetical protein ACKO23_16630 [Gemmataceae bacterium]